MTLAAATLAAAAATVQHWRRSIYESVGMTVAMVANHLHLDAVSHQASPPMSALACVAEVEPLTEGELLTKLESLTEVELLTAERLAATAVDAAAMADAAA
eukprot:CAMPEP_0119350596 /NCGR_PEP_ID=MMETSP1333-20130426/110139_1 /TAXON_ID=418940 /ORGANISM="Scyphosphaera apsteinii, Strain RCC1455" /LENGTH=100 /DNA_ID=CAMNT_0007363213 /DNA_START=916 /DNA_END=1215 /DNA_ORIENTATION=+